MPEPSSHQLADPANLNSRAKVALIASLSEALPPDRAALVDDSGRTKRFEDNLVEALTVDQIEELREQLAAGSGSELKFGIDGSRPDAHAANSSAALAFNSFGLWLGREQDLVICGLSGFTERLRVEAKLPIFRGGTPPNLDCLLAGPEIVVGVESKLTEPMSPHGHPNWSQAYDRETCRALLSDGWLEVFDEARCGDLDSRYLDADQLIKHALGLSKNHPGTEKHLVYVYWEPEDASLLACSGIHRDEVKRLLERVGDSEPRLHAVSYRELWDEWLRESDDALVPSHVAQLRQRYSISVLD